jgi:hypothetical protein
MGIGPDIWVALEIRQINAFADLPCEGIAKALRIEGPRLWPQNLPHGEPSQEDAEYGHDVLPMNAIVD